MIAAQINTNSKKSQQQTRRFKEKFCGFSVQLQRNNATQDVFFHDEREEQSAQSQQFYYCFLCAAPLYVLACLSSHFTDISKPL